MSIDSLSLLNLINTLLHGALITICINWVVRLVNEGKRRKNSTVQLRKLVCWYLSWMAFSFCYDLAWVCLADFVYGSLTARLILLQLDSLTFPFTTILMTQLTHRKPLSVGLVLAHFLPFIVIPPIGIWLQKTYFFYALIIVTAIYAIASITVNAISGNRYSRYICEEYADLQGKDIKWINQFFVLYCIQIITWVVAIWYNSQDILQLVYYIVCLFVVCLLASNLKRMIHVSEHNLDEIMSVEETHNTVEDIIPATASTLPYNKDFDFLERLHKECVETKLYTHPTITREELSRAMGINHTYFTRMLHDKTGMNFNEYINNLRLDYAEQLLADLSIPLNAIPAIAGFNSKATYYSAFTKRFNCTPKVYREQMIPS